MSQDELISENESTMSIHLGHAVMQLANILTSVLLFCAFSYLEWQQN